MTINTRWLNYPAENGDSWVFSLNTCLALRGHEGRSSNVFVCHAPGREWRGSARLNFAHAEGVAWMTKFGIT